MTVARAIMGIEDVRDRKDIAALMASKRVSCVLRGAWTGLQWVGSEEVVSAMRGYTDGSAELSKGWPRVSQEAGWGLVLQGRGPRNAGWRLLGMACGPVGPCTRNAELLMATAPTSPAAELAAVGMAVCAVADAPELQSVPCQLLSDNLGAVHTVQCRSPCTLR